MIEISFFLLLLTITYLTGVYFKMLTLESAMDNIFRMGVAYIVLKLIWKFVTW